MRCVRCRYQQLRRHAPDRGASRPREAIVYEQGTGTGPTGASLSSQAAGTCTNDGDVAGSINHLEVLPALSAATCADYLHRQRTSAIAV
jgi:hypothetical protein